MPYGSAHRFFTGGLFPGAFNDFPLNGARNDDHAIQVAEKQISRLHMHTVDVQRHPEIHYAAPWRLILAVPAPAEAGEIQRQNPVCVTVVAVAYDAGSAKRLASACT